MLIRIRKIGNDFVLPPHVVDDLDLTDGSVVEITRVDVSGAPDFRYATNEEAMKAHREMEPSHAAAYRELAKGPEGVGPHDPPPFDLKKW